VGFVGPFTLRERFTVDDRDWSSETVIGRLYDPVTVESASE
jgi:hypothetical protein